MREIANRDELETAVNAKTLTLVWYSAHWCRPCRRIDAAAAQAAADAGRITFVYCDIDKVSTAVHLHSINRIPTFILFRDGREVQRLGSSDTAEIVAWIASAKREGVD